MRRQSFDTDAPTGLPIRTDRLTIRPLHFTDVDAMHTVYSDPEVTRFIPGGVRDMAGTHQRVADLIGHHNARGVSKWAVTLSDSGLLIGDCGLQFLPGRTELELGFHFSRAHWGNGYATEAASACLRWALANRLERILAIVDPNHHSSQRVLIKLGMQQTGQEELFGQQWLIYEANRDK